MIHISKTLLPLYSLCKEKHVQVLTITFLLVWRMLELCRELQVHWLSHTKMTKAYFIAANYCTNSKQEAEQKVILIQSY